jgi:hypothetical protein
MEVSQYNHTLIMISQFLRLIQASALAGLPNQPLHTAEGIVTTPYTFQQQGAYIITITVYGILFNPIKPEVAQFPVNCN